MFGYIVVVEQLQLPVEQGYEDLDVPVAWRI